MSKIERPYKGNTTIKENYSEIIITIPVEKKWFSIIFLGAWLCGWCFGEIFVIYTLILSGGPVGSSFFTLFWLIGWTVGGVFAWQLFLWQIVGKEIISVHKGVLTIEKNIRLFRRTKKYDISSIKDLTLSTDDTWNGLPHFGPKSSFMKSFTGNIKFDYGMKTIKFGGELEEAEAKIIIEKFKENSNFKEENFSAKNN